jgi:hypothetical protein
VPAGPNGDPSGDFLDYLLRSAVLEHLLALLTDPRAIRSPNPRLGAKGAPVAAVSAICAKRILVALIGVVTHDSITMRREPGSLTRAPRSCRCLV